MDNGLSIKSTGAMVPTQWIGMRAIREMLHIREIDHVVLRAQDVQAMIRFYGEVLGCPVHRVDEKNHLVQLRAGRGLIDLVPRDSNAKNDARMPALHTERNMDHVCLRVDPWDSDAILAHLQACQVDAGPVTRRFGAEGRGPSIYLRDPEGNIVELKGPPDPLP